MPGRYRCVYCLHRFELTSVCPNCGEHSTIVRMSSTALVKCNNCGDSMLQADMSARSNELLSGVRVAPSILSADFARLREQVAEVLDAGARVIHVDVMDGHFVPPITVGPLVVAALREQVRRGRRDARRAPDDRAPRAPRRASSCKAGADSITFHAEATPHVAYTADLIREGGVGVGVAINPATPVGALAEVVELLDMALCMTVNPGWGGQPFIAHSPQKIERVRAIVGAGVAVEVDGGIDPETAPALPGRPARACSWPARRSSARRPGRGLPGDRALRRGRLSVGRRPAAESSLRVPAPVQHRQRGGQQRGRAGVADLGAQQLFAHGRDEHPREEQRPPPAPSSRRRRARGRAPAPPG